MPIDVGDFYPVTIQTRAEPTTGQTVGDLLDTDDVTLTVTNLVTGVAGAPVTLAHTGTGTYKYDIPCLAAGFFRWDAVATGAVEGTWWDVFTVTAGSAFVSVEEALAHLKAQQIITPPQDVEQLRWLCQVACDAVERNLGLVIGRRAVADTWDGGRRELMLRKVPPRVGDGGAVTDVTVTEDGATLVEGTDFIVRRSRWSLVRGAGTISRCWTPGIENIAVTYTVLCDPIPIVVRKVALNAVQRMWQSSQQLPMPYLDDVSAQDAIFSSTGTLTPVELGAYQSLPSGTVGFA